jgi:hypothetical protein
VADGLAEVAFAGGDLAGAARLLGLAEAIRGVVDRGSPAVRRLRDALAVPTLALTRAQAIDQLATHGWGS